MKPRRKSSFYYVSDSTEPLTPRKWLCTVILFIISLMALMIMVFSSSFTLESSNSMIDKRFGACPQYKCTEKANKLGIVVPFMSFKEKELINMLNRMESNTKTLYSNYVDLVIVPIGGDVEDLQDSINKIPNLEKHFSKVNVHKPFEGVSDANSLLQVIIEDADKIFPQYCYVSLLSPHTHFIKDTWIDSMILRTINASNTDFWIKGPIDVSVQPFTRFESLEISLYSLYAIHCNCLKELFRYADESEPAWKLTKFLTYFLRTEANLRLSQWMAPHYQPSPYSANFKSTLITIPEITHRFPEVEIAEGSKIIEKE